jgi:hypothetical protein
MTHLDSQLVHGRRLLAIFISPVDPEDQYAITGIARWDGAALWLQSDRGHRSSSDHQSSHRTRLASQVNQRANPRVKLSAREIGPVVAA